MDLNLEAILVQHAEEDIEEKSSEPSPLQSHGNNELFVLLNVQAHLRNCTKIYFI